MSAFGKRSLRSACTDWVVDNSAWHCCHSIQRWSKGLIILASQCVLQSSKYGKHKADTICSLSPTGMLLVLTCHAVHPLPGSPRNA